MSGGGFESEFEFECVGDWIGMLKGGCVRFMGVWRCGRFVGCLGLVGGKDR